MGITGNNSGVRIAIAILLLLFIAAGAGWCSRAEAQENATSVSIGPLSFGGEACVDSLLIARELGEGKWLAGMITHGSGDCRGEHVSAQIGLLALHQLRFGERFSIGFGGAIFEHGDIGIGKESILADESEPRQSQEMQLAGVISVRAYLLAGRFVIDLPMHFSTGNASRFNPGKNALLFGYRF
jgi:hypothetical protein